MRSWLFIGEKSTHGSLFGDDQDSPASDAICVIGAPEEGDGLVLESFDSRGIRRTYGTAIEDGVWRMWRDAADFDRRLEARLGKDVFEGLVQLAETPGEWQDDMRVRYRRA